MSGAAAILGHTRLSIIDLESGRQPFYDKSKEIHAVCNGEIYNHLDIRQQSTHRYPFRTRSDCEILIPLHQQMGVQAVQKLDGMFAFLLSDGEQFLAGRDPIGIKPLYYGYQQEAMYFASEAKGLDGLVDRIHEFPHGHVYHSGEGFARYYHLPNPEEDAWLTDEEDVLDRVRATLEESVRKRLMADVPVGIFLSGGLDSSIIAALVSKHADTLHTFAVGMRDSQDLIAARAVADYLGTDHHELVFDAQDVREAIDDIVYHLESYDPALIRSAIPNWFVAKLTHQTRWGDEYCKVILTGEGADELFAGYKYLRSINDRQVLQQELRRLVDGLHHLNLQRVDRMTMAHSIEARVPFLDEEFIALALQIDPHLKLHSNGGKEKAILRKAFRDLLPDSILYRKKMEFGQGSTVGEMLEQLAASEVDEEEFINSSSEEELESTEFKQASYFRRILSRSIRTPFADGALGKWKGPLL